MLLSTREMSWLKSILIGVCGLCCWSSLSIFADEEPVSLWKTLKIDPLLGAYLEEGCTISVSINADGEKPLLNGNFRVISDEGNIVMEGTYNKNRFEGDLKVFGTSGALFALERYKNGRLAGERIEWDEAGDVRIVTPYDDGEKTGIERYFANGIVQREIVWQKGTPSEIRLFRDGNQIGSLSGQAMWDHLKANMERAKKE